MPFYREFNPDDGVRAGIWQITETAEELYHKIQLSSNESIIYDTFRHDLRKRHWLAYRLLLKHLLAPLNTGISYDAHGKPFLDSKSHHISVSHAGDFAAAVCSEKKMVGIDIEHIRDRIERVKDRFLQKSELDSLLPENRLEQLYVCWGGKEALYKLQGDPGIDFRNDIYIHPFDYLCNTNQYGRAALKFNGSVRSYSLWFEKVGDYMLVVAY
jgi:phosphopantetheinyl transferase